VPGEWGDLDHFAAGLANLIAKATHSGTDGRKIYYVLKAFELSLGKKIEEQFGPQKLAEIQQAAFEERLLQVHAIPPRGR